MPLALFIIGTALIVSALRGTEKQLGALVIGDIQGGFLKWLAAIFIIGLLGYVPRAEVPSRFLLALVLLVLFLANGTGFFAAFQQQTSNVVKVDAPATVQITAPPTVNVTIGTGGGGIAGAISSATGGFLGQGGTLDGIVKTGLGIFGL